MKQCNNDVHELLSKYINYNGLNSETRYLISSFAILWNSFERELFPSDEYRYGYTKRDVLKIIYNYEFDKFLSDKINESYGKLMGYLAFRKCAFDPERIVRFFGIFLEDLYRPDGNLFRRRDIDKDTLSRIMFSDKTKDRLSFLYLIAKKVRNNMIHGEKGLCELDEQVNLFDACNQTLAIIIAIGKSERRM